MSLLLVGTSWIGASLSHQSVPMAPPGMALPYVVSPGCPGEYCSYGSWKACDSIPVYEQPDDEGHQTAWLVREEAINVQTGQVQVHVPGAVRVTREVWQDKDFSVEKIHLAEGDTIFVLDDLGEGAWNVWHGGQIDWVAMFWPWERWHTPPGYQYSGEVLQEVQSEFWVFFQNEDGKQGWVIASWPKMISAFRDNPIGQCPGLGPS